MPPSISVQSANLKVPAFDCRVDAPAVGQKILPLQEDDLRLHDRAAFELDAAERHHERILRQPLSGNSAAGRIAACTA
jgi:hypothetical protein